MCTQQNNLLLLLNISNGSKQFYLHWHQQTELVPVTNLSILSWKRKTCRDYHKSAIVNRKTLRFVVSLYNLQD